MVGRSPQIYVQNLLKSLADSSTAKAQGKSPRSRAENNSWMAERTEQRLQQLPGTGETEFEVKIYQIRGAW